MMRHDMKTNKISTKYHGKYMVAVLAAVMLLTCGVAASAGQEPETGPAQVLTDGSPVTEETVKTILESIKIDWPEGTQERPYYSGMKSPVRVISKTYPAYNYRTGEHVRKNMISTVYGCAGWVSRISDRIFGQDIAYREIDLQSAHPGDFAVQVNADGEAMHFVLITDTPVIETGKITFDVTESATRRNGTYYIRWTTYEHETDDTRISYRVYTAWPDQEPTEDS